MAEIYDNIETNFLDGLKGVMHGQSVKRVDFCVGYFNLRGWRHIAEDVDVLPGSEVREPDEDGRLIAHHRTCRLLVGMYKSPKDLIREEFSSAKSKVDNAYATECKYQIAKDFCKQLCIGVPTAETEKALQKLLEQLKSGKVVVKLYLRHQLHAKLYIAHRENDAIAMQAIMGSSNLTQGGFNSNGELNARFDDSDHVRKLDKWFNDRWNDPWCLDITQEIIDAIETSWASPDPIPPYYIYLKTAYHLSEDARAGFNEFDIPKEFENKLFDFQVTAAKLAARNLDKRGGAMIGDVVGLGKTITACAVAKMYENSIGCCTLIICPANLQEMWQGYIKKYDLKADVLSIDKKFEPDQMRCYRLCIIDESHNLRNRDSVRYKRIRELLKKQGSRVLLLTATAYNKSYLDISSQLRLFISNDTELGIRPEKYIEVIGGDNAFASKHSQISNQTIQAFELSDYPDDWSSLMKHFLVRRTRTFIKNNYAKTDDQNGRLYLQFSDGKKSYFPDRIPHTVKFNVSENSQYAKLYSDEMLAKIDRLKLPRYGLSQYIDDRKTADVATYIKKTLDHLSKAGKRLMGFCLSTFGKRMDSCGYAFLLTLKRHLLRNLVYLYAIEHRQPLPIGDTNDIGKFYDETMDDEDGENNEQNPSLDSACTLEDFKKIAETYYKNLFSSNPSNIDWLDSAYFKRSLKKHLTEDRDVLLEMLQLCGEWDPSKDPKLDELHRLLTQNHPNDSVLVFTQYADTAEYLCRELQKRGITDVASVTGNCDHISELVCRFSPKSNEDLVKGMQIKPIRILIATDVLSEGQNLQDAHVIMNFDMPWAIIRLIQRAGRVDRIGQTSETIDCYSFFPADGIEKVIRLRERLKERIRQNANVLGSDEEFFEGNATNLDDLYNEKAGILDSAEDDGDVDTASMAYQIWKNATEAKPELKDIIQHMGNVSYSAKAAKDGKSGGITYARTYNNFDVLTWLSNHKDEEGKYQIISQSQNVILNALACPIDEPVCEPLAEHHEMVGQAVAHVRKQSMGFTFAGALGYANSTRKKIHDILYEASQKTPDLWFSREKLELVKKALQEVYETPLLENTQELLKVMLRDGETTDAIINTVIARYLKHELCLSSEDRTQSKDPMILCSMGLCE